MRAPGSVWLGWSVAIVFMFAVIVSLEARAAAEGEVSAHDPSAVINRVLSAWRSADARAIAALYEPRGDFVSPTGEHAVGRGEIEAFYKAAFEKGYAGSAALATAVHVRALSATFALIDGHWTINPTPRSKITESESGLFFAVLRWYRGRWWIAALREQTSAKDLHELNVRSDADAPQ